MSNIREEYKCAKKSKFMQAVFIGALAGAAVSLFDKNTRSSVLANSKSCMSNMKELVKNPNGVLTQVRETSSKVRATVEKISDDVSFISQKSRGNERYSIASCACCDGDEGGLLCGRTARIVFKP